MGAYACAGALAWHARAGKIYCARAGGQFTPHWPILATDWPLSTPTLAHAWPTPVPGRSVGTVSDVQTGRLESPSDGQAASAASKKIGLLGAHIWVPKTIAKLSTTSTSSTVQVNSSYMLVVNGLVECDEPSNSSSLDCKLSPTMGSKSRGSGLW